MVFAYGDSTAGSRGNSTGSMALDCLRMAVRARDPLTPGRGLAAHEEGVARLSMLLAEARGLPSERVELIGRAAGVHDIGKLAIPDAVLLNPGEPTRGEWGVLRAHTILGARILGGSGDATLDLAARIAAEHHEAFDGSGYPRGLRGDGISPEARLVALCDVYDALRHVRPYKRALSHAEAMDVMRDGDHRMSPARFDPGMLRSFLDLDRHVEATWEEGEAAARSGAIQASP
ncbi:HD-GYP domain-containing protein [Arenibaculum pallidiluteum]|uniref:HD-GYP domain-containing protein n=1 Tax=Arenibaculum pallidiluteum TaxID=2812559 RepID=UPI001A973C64|nr:HD domain-containing phosphohydrolase [Arenibaculum pallidiluteum]